MCDTGILEQRPDSMKLDYCIEIPVSIQQKLVKGISDLIGEPVQIVCPKAGEFPKKGDNSIEIETVAKKGWKTYVTRFSLEQLPGCSGVLVSCHVLVYRDYQNKGINSFLQGIREDIAEWNNYRTLMCTTTSDNDREIHILEKHGWKRVHEFNNKRTGHTVYTYMKNLM